MTDHNTTEQERQLRELRSIELQQIATRTLLENKALLVEILDFLREQSRHRNAIDLTIFSHSGANGAPTPRGIRSTATKSRIHKIEPERKIKNEMQRSVPEPAPNGADPAT
jgi:hypothetical protein